MPDPLWLDSSLSRIRGKSKTFADRASEVSEIIERVDAQLRDIPGKIPVEVREGEIALGVGRAFEWGIWVTDNDSDGPPGDEIAEPLISVSIKRKIRAMPLLTKLLDEIEAEQDRQLQVIEAVSESLLTRMVEGR